MKGIPFTIGFVFFLLASWTQAQVGNLSGTVSDAQSGKAMADVEVLIEGSRKGTVTDRNGMFSIQAIPVGAQTIEIRHLGFVTQKIGVQIKPNTTLRLKIALDPKVTELSPIEIRDQLIRNIPYIRSEMVRADILESPARDVGDQLRQTPNVAGVRKGGVAIDPVVRGFRFGQLNVQVDNGMKIEGGCPNRMDPTVAHIEPEEIDRMEVIKGPFALRYGPVMGGVINIRTLQPKPRDAWGVSIHGIKSYESNWNGNREYLAIDGGNRHLFFRASGSKKDYGNYNDGNGNTIPSSFRKYSYKLQGGTIPKEGHRLSLSWERSKGRDVDYVALPMDERSDDTELWMADYTFNPKGEVFNSLKVKLYRSDVLHVMDNKARPFSDTTATVSTVNAINTGGRAEAGFFLGTGHLYAGIDIERITKDGDRVKNVIGQPNFPIFIEQLWNEAWINNLGVFGEYRVNFGKMEFIASARIDLNSANSEDVVIKKMNNQIYFNNNNSSSFTNLSASVGAIRKINDHLTANLAIGRGVRSPDMLERFIILLPVGFDRFDYLGNPQLKPEANHQIDLTFTYAHPRIGELELNGFSGYVTNYITGQWVPKSQQTSLTQGVLGVKRFYNADYATLSGFEFMYTSPIDWPLRVSLIAAYTHGVLGEYVKYTLQGGEVVGQEPLTGDALPEIPPFEATATVQYPLVSGRLIPKASLRKVAAQKHLSESYGEDETPGFSVLDLALTYKFNELLRVSGGIKNVFDLAYYEHLNRRMILSSADLYEPGRLFFVNLIVDIK